MIFSSRDSFSRFKRPFTLMLRVIAIFLTIFSGVYFILVPVRGMLAGILEPWAGFFSIILGTGVIAILALWGLIVHTRFGALLTVVAFLYWYAVPCNWIVREWESMRLNFAGTYVIMWINVIVIGVALLLGLVMFVLESVCLGIHERSVFWGHGFPSLRTSSSGRSSRGSVMIHLRMSLFRPSNLSLLLNAA